MSEPVPEEPHWSEADTATDGFPSWPPAPTAPKRRGLRTALIITAALLTLCCAGSVVFALASRDHSASPVAVGPGTVSPAPSDTSVTPAAEAPVATATPSQPAATPTTTPSAAQPTTTRPTPKLCGAPANPYGYNFCGGSLITNPARDICSYLKCVDHFFDGGGYVVQCRDMRFSETGGTRRVCKFHSGYLRSLFR